MRKMICIAVATLFIFASQACAGPEATLTNDEATALLKDAIPNVKVLNVSKAPINGLWEVMLQAGRNKGIVYIDSTKKYFVSGMIFDIAAKKNVSKERFDELNKKYADSDKLDASKIPTDDALVFGAADAKYRVIVFTDPDCPYCGKLHGEMKKVIEKRKDIVFLIKMFPLPMHPDAKWKAKSIICKKSVKLLEDNFAKKKIEKADCDTTAVDDNIKLAGELGIDGTPAIILPDGAVVSGAREADALIKLITKE
jgi:thiol:disulfide interchange protein DsbC